MRILIFSAVILTAPHLSLAELEQPKDSYAPTAIDNSQSAPAEGHANADEDFAEKLADASATSNPAPTPPPGMLAKAEEGREPAKPAPEPSPLIPSVPQVATSVSDGDADFAPIKKTGKPTPKPRLVQIPGQTLNLPATASRTTPDETPFIWNETPVSVAFDQLSRIRGMRIQAIGTELACVSGDFTKLSGPETLQAIATHCGFLLEVKDGTYHLAPQSGAAKILLSTARVTHNVTKLYYIPMSSREGFLKVYDEHRQGDSKIVPISSPSSSMAVFRITTREPIHSKLESAAKQAVEVAARPVPEDASAAKLRRQREKLLKKRADLEQQANSASRF